MRDLNKKREKVMYGGHVRSIDRQLIGVEDTFLQLSRTDLKAEPESETKAAQYRDLLTSYHSTKALKRQIDSKCILRQKYGETNGPNCIRLFNIGRRTVHKETL
jgi:hypothetical protein